MGSAAIGGAIAHIAFWILLGRGYFSDEMSMRACAIALALWAAGFFALPYVPYSPPFSTYIALIDIGLVFAIFKGDVRLT